MVQPCQVISEEDRRDERIEKERYEIQSELKELYESYIVEAKERIKLEKSAIIEENIRVEIRNWVSSCYQQTGKIPELPSAESGGSRIIFSRQVCIIMNLKYKRNKQIKYFTQIFFNYFVNLLFQDTDSSLSKSTGVSSSKESKRSKKSAKTAKETEQQSDPESEVGFKPMTSNFLPDLAHANEEYQHVWKDKDESSNFAQLPYFDMVDDEKTREVEDEIRLGVDNTMRSLFYNNKISETE